MSFICTGCNREARSTDGVVPEDWGEFQNMITGIDAELSESNPDWDLAEWALYIAGEAKRNDLCAMCAIVRWMANLPPFLE